MTRQVLAEARGHRLLLSSGTGTTPDTSLANLRAMVDEKRKAGRDVPVINWRYILFTWNDSDEEMDLARRMAADIGVPFHKGAEKFYKEAGAI